MLFSTPVMAEEPIVGAFGLKLGDVWDGEATKTYEGDYYVGHHFIPESPSDMFAFYFINVTPIKGLIYTIGAGWNDDDCSIQFIALKKLLSKKYGSGEIVHKDRLLADAKGHEWFQGNRIIELNCYPFTGYRLILSYTDKFIEASGIDELTAQAEAQAESADL